MSETVFVFIFVCVFVFIFAKKSFKNVGKVIIETRTASVTILLFMVCEHNMRKVKKCKEKEDMIPLLYESRNL